MSFDVPWALVEEEKVRENWEVEESTIMWERK